MERSLNTLLVFILSCVLLGALWMQFIVGEKPCPLCYLQRLGMMGLGCSLLLNVRLGIRKAHYGMALLWCFFGGFIALRHIALHVCPEFPASPWKPVLGLNLYTWSFIVFSLSVLYIGLLLISFDKPVEKLHLKKFFWWEIVVFSLLLFVAFVNILATLNQCGLGPCAD